MLGWLSGAAQRGAGQAPKDEIGSLWVDEPPETPAPVFAVRAFKTALFGTPHPNQSEETVIEGKASPEKPGRSKHSPRAKFLTPKPGNKVHSFHTQRSTPLISPAKGILLTPGTATTRRKTVSFGGLDNRLEAIEDGEEKDQQDLQVATQDSEKQTVNTSPEKDGAKEIPVQPSLTKASFRAQLEASKQRLSERSLPAKTTTEVVLAPNYVAQLERPPVRLDLGDFTADYTVDLTKPRSQSGQHWKAEFERYQQNSDRELKKVIQHGQNVKSYAEKMNVEATELQEKLKRELVKCAAMETKVSRLATQLASSKKDGTKGSSEQENLMNDLSRQTALAIRYKQKADKYRVAIQQHKSSSLGQNYNEEQGGTEDLTTDISSTGPLPAADNTRGDSELSSLRAELRAFRLKLSIAEERAAKLKAENSELTRNYLRVKDDMNNCDARRVRKEARFKERVDALVAEKLAWEEKFKLLSTEHEDLQRRVKEQPVRASERQPVFHSSQDRPDAMRMSTLPGEHQESRPGTNIDCQTNVSLEIVSPTHSKSRDDQKDKAPFKAPAIDIWTMDTPSDTGDMDPSAAEPAINLSSIALSHATHEALREIDRNSVSEDPPELASPSDRPRPTQKHLATVDSQPGFPSSDPTSAAKRMVDRRNTIPSPRPSMVSMTSSTVNQNTQPPRAGASGWRRDISRVSAVGIRTSTLNGGKGRSGEVPPDRKAAAKARLAQRKSLKESGRM
ncbi:MAG: hypothetical protein Q9221_006132 [Calogaya cf. arnoldii]